MAFFGADKISLSKLTELEESSPEIIVYAIPVMAFFTFLEIGFSWFEKKQIYKTRESIGSTLVGLGNVFINFLIKTGMIYGAVWIYNLVPWRMELSWWTIIPCYLLFDLCSYWSHRISHENRFLWATHIVHHSAETYNLTVAFRLSWIQNIKILFFLPVALLGFHPVVFFVTSQVSVLFQFWVHTEYIGRLHPYLEYLLATPSNHRVHHGRNEKYLDKNFAATFIFWDRMFRTYQKEEERPDYGITTPIGNRLNPLFLNFHELNDIIKDVRKAKGLKKKLFYLFGSPTDIYHEKLKDKSQ
ncbi:sterol desaturase family protein [Pedobacter frigoris]|uniref:Sterol desaturase family protein n=1 Tax=Pedobacter frigoris TaxID=2571272 RepID=A0A4U1CDU7_9SPHI|nr:sterol desaturase family protein [Pedobacter frigoris]TKC04384.1 sterol desaturase family protein [Pedobacter frigoris]